MQDVLSDRGDCVGMQSSPAAAIDGFLILRHQNSFRMCKRQLIVSSYIICQEKEKEGKLI